MATSRGGAGRTAKWRLVTEVLGAGQLGAPPSGAGDFFFKQPDASRLRQAGPLKIEPLILG